MGLASLPPCSPTRAGRVLLSPFTIGVNNWLLDTASIARYFPGLCCGRKTALAKVLRGTKEQERAVWNLAPALCHWGSPRLAKCGTCSVRRCWLRSREIPACGRSMTYFYIRYHGGGR